MNALMRGIRRPIEVGRTGPSGLYKNNFSERLQNALPCSVKRSAFDKGACTCYQIRHARCPTCSCGKPGKFIGRLKGKIKIVGDVLTPIVAAEDWEYDRDKF
jgi:hypothetical protein